MSVELYNGDCLEVMEGLPDASVDCIITDPPYFDVMGSTANDDGKGWDEQWEDMSEFVDWLDDVLAQFQRILKPAGSLYMFADDLNAAEVQITINGRFKVLNNIVWHKTNDMRLKGWRDYRTFAGTTERVIFAEQRGRIGNGSATGLQAIHSNPDCFAPIKEYMRAERDRVMADKGFTKKAEFDAWINEVTGTKSVASRHYFSDSQYVFPTKEIYEKMQATGYWQRPYENEKSDYDGLVVEYEGLRNEYEKLRRKFHPPQNYTDVWRSAITINEDGEQVHPCQKPQKILRIPIETSTDPGDVILDAFMGSGSTGIAAVSAGRSFIGIEKDAEYFQIAKSRIGATEYREKRKTTLDRFI